MAPSAGEEEEPYRAWAHAVLYGGAGFLLGLCSPLGAYLMRYWRADPLLPGLWATSELAYNFDFYLYMGVGSVAAFTSFGVVLGRRSDRQRSHARSLRARVADLHLKSVTDGLTGVYSHAYLQETLSIEMERARRHGHPLSVLLLDLDDFKRINDTHGHLFGDQVLKEVTETLSMNLRQEDVLGRYGGEEFLVIMPGADAEVAQRVAERICRAVARAELRDASGGAPQPLSCTVSIGAASFSGGKLHDPAGLIREADRNLYRAKREGKNRVCRD